MDKELIQFKTTQVFLAKENSRLEKVAKRIGIVLPSNHTTLFQSIFAPLDKANNNGHRLAKKAVAESLPNLVGSQANLNHLGKNWLLGIILDAWINDDNEIEIIFSFAKNVFEDEYIAALEAMAEGKLTVSFELSAEKGSLEKLSDGTILVNDISWDGVGVLIGKKPAYKNAKVYEMASLYKERATQDKELIFASDIIKSCDKIIEDKDIDYEEDLIAVQLTAAKWTRKYINSLPDSSFAVIEPDYKNGKSDNKNARHLPYKDANGKIDLPHYRNALARVNQIKPITNSISKEELVNQAQKELDKHKEVLKSETQPEGGVKSMEFTEEQKTLISILKAELGEAAKDWKDEDFLNAEKVEAVRKIKVEPVAAKEEVKKEAEVVKVEPVKAEQKRLCEEQRSVMTIYKDDGSTETQSFRECTYTWVDSEGKKQVETIKEAVIDTMVYSASEINKIKEDAVKEVKSSLEATQIVLKAENEQLKVQVADFVQKAEKIIAEEKTAVLDGVKSELKDNPYAKEFKDEDFLNAEKVQVAKDRKERDDLKAENVTLKTKAPVEKENLETGHNETKSEVNPRVIIKKLGKKS